MESILPQELMELVIDELGFEVASSLDDDHPMECRTLQNCALASRSLRSRATHWLFFRARLQGKEGYETWIQKRVDKFHNILVHNPSIGWSVRELFISTAPDGFKNWWDNKRLISVLGRLCQIQRFSLQHRAGPIRWEALAPKTATAIESIILSPSLRKLELHTIQDFPWFILHGCRTLKGLSLVCVQTSLQHSTAPVHTATANTFPILVSAKIFSALSTEFLLSNPMTAKMFSRLRTLSVGLPYLVGTETAVNLIIEASQTLETLNISGLKARSSRYVLLSSVMSKVTHYALIFDSKL